MCCKPQRVAPAYDIHELSELFAILAVWGLTTSRSLRCPPTRAPSAAHAFSVFAPGRAARAQAASPCQCPQQQCTMSTGAALPLTLMRLNALTRLQHCGLTSQRLCYTPHPSSDMVAGCTASGVAAAATELC